jgi:hypothetical protein
MGYAEKTTVPVDRSKAEIERILKAHGSTGFAYLSNERVSEIQFIFRNNLYKISLIMPKKEEFIESPRGRSRKDSIIDRMHEQECRSRWRELLLLIKAKFIAIERGTRSVEQEFAADIVLPDNRTLYQHLSKALEMGKLPRALPMIAESSEG